MKKFIDGDLSHIKNLDFETAKDIEEQSQYFRDNDANKNYQ